MTSFSRGLLACLCVCLASQASAQSFGIFQSPSEDEKSQEPEISPISVAIKIGDLRMNTEDRDYKVAPSRNAMFQLAYQLGYERSFRFNVMYEYVKTDFYPASISEEPIWESPLEYQSHGVYLGMRTKSIVYGFAKVGGVLSNLTEHKIGEEEAKEDQQYALGYGVGIGYAINQHFALEYEYQVLGTDIKTGSIVGRYRF